MHAKATSPVTLDAGDAIYSPYDEDREVTDVSFTGGDVVISLKSGQNVTGASTLGYLVPDGNLGAGRNVVLDLTYTITQNAPIKLANARGVAISTFKQGKLVDPEVDASRSGSHDGMRYRIYTPANHRGMRPLIVWLHGNGEGGLSASYYNNEPQLRANRGALGMTTSDAQRIFGGAYVVAPQVPDTWYNLDLRLRGETAGADPGCRQEASDRPETHLHHGCLGRRDDDDADGEPLPKLFAAAVASAPALFVNRESAYKMTAEQVLRLKPTPTWLVQAKNDPTIDYEKSSLWAYNLLKDYGKVTLTTYDDVTWNGVTYNGHWSWIYTAHNDPSVEQITKTGNSRTPTCGSGWRARSGRPSLRPGHRYKSAGATRASHRARCSDQLVRRTCREMRVLGRGHFAALSGGGPGPVGGRAAAGCC